MLGSTISLLSIDPTIDCPISPRINATFGGCPNPNTTFFESAGITDTGVANPDTEALFRSQFTPDVSFGVNGTGSGMPNATSSSAGQDSGDLTTSINEFIDAIDVFNIRELIRFLAFINPFYTFDVMAGMFDKIGIPTDAGFLLAIKAIFFFLGVLAVIFVIFKIDLI